MTTVPLKYLVDPRRPITYGIVQAGPDTPGGTPYIRPVDMTSTSGVPDVAALQRTTAEIASAYRRSVVRAGDLVVSIGPSYGKVMLVPQALEGANLTQGTARVAPTQDVDARFLYWALQTSLAKQHWDVSVGGATFRALNLEPLARTPVPMVPRDEQQRIAQFLDDQIALLDRAIALRQEQVGLLEDRFETERDACFDNLVGQPARLKHLCCGPGQYGLNISASEYVPQASDALRLIRTSDLTEWGLADESDGIFVPFVEDERFLLREGDLLASRAGTVGKVYLTPPEAAGMTFAGFLVRLRARQGVLPRYLMHSIQRRRTQQYIQQNAVVSTILNFNAERYGDLPVVAVPLHEQVSVVSRLDTALSRVRRAKDPLQRSLGLLGERKQALITAAVTGQFNVVTARRMAVA